MNNQFEKPGQNQPEKNQKPQQPEAKHGQTPGQKSVVTGTGDEKKTGFGQSQGQSQSQGQPGQKTPGFSQYGDQSKKDTQNESIGYQPGVNNPGREQYQDPQAKQQPGKDREVPQRPEREGGDLEHLRNPDKTTAPERKEIDPVASSKRESDQQIKNNPSGQQDQQNPIV